MKIDAFTEEILLALTGQLGTAAATVGEAGASRASEYETRVDTGRLRASIAHKEVKDGIGYDVYIGSDVEYAPAHELGSSKGIKPLHFLKRAAENHTEEYKQILIDQLKHG